MWKYILLGILLLLFIIAIIFIYFYTKTPNPNNECNNATPQWVRPNCVFIQENYADSTITDPQQQLYLGAFSYDPNLSGGPLCQPMWYSFRYVRLSDGGYSSLSPWTPLPIFSGAAVLPCYPSTSYEPNNMHTLYNKCPDEKLRTVSDYCNVDNIIEGTGSCQFNRPTIVTVDPLDQELITGYVLNLHRQVGTFDPNSEGQIIGFLIPDTNNQQGWTSHWVDILYNPNQANSRCQGC